MARKDLFATVGNAAESNGLRIADRESVLTLELLRAGSPSREWSRYVKVRCKASHLGQVSRPTLQRCVPAQKP
jgi:hypothetical protein